MASQYNRFQEGSQLESDQKDLIISQLKSELFELRQGEKDYNLLAQQIKNIEHRYGVLVNDKDRTEGEFRNRQDANMRQAQGLRHEVELIKNDISNINIEISQLRSENVNINDEAEQRQLEIIRLNGEISDSENLRRRLNNDAQDLEREVIAQIEEKKKNLDELDRAGQRADDLAHKNRALENDVSELKYEKNSLEKENQSMVDTGKQLERETRVKEDQCREQEMILNDMNKDIRNMEDDVRNLENIIDKNKAESLRQQKLHQNEQFKNKETTEEIKSCESRIAQKDSNSMQLKDDLSAQRRENIELKEDSNFLDADIERHLTVTSEVQLINRELHDELERYSEEDERARIQLNRRDKIREMITKSENRVKTSVNSIMHISGPGVKQSRMN